MPTPEQVRAVVRQVVEEVLGNSPGLQGGEPSVRRDSPEPQGGERSVAIGSDHGGFSLKEILISGLREAGYAVTDCGTFSSGACDYPDFAHEVAQRVSDGSCRNGVIVDGAGIGSAMVANKVPGVRAALCYDLSSARNSREHNHANVLTLGAALIGVGLAKQILETWFQTPWGPDRHARRVEKISAVEARYLCRP